ncbi:MAG: alkene reductase [Hymenobacter sp.]|nr:MAG: alkene reductase [Hymenobacter sp.]
MENKLFTPTRLGNIDLNNHMVMAPMTRNRATPDNVPTEMMAEYYAQRAGAGLIITEGTSPSPNGLGYAFIPGIYNDAQIAGWKKVTDAVHEKGGRIFVQLMHTGRVSAPENLPQGAEILAPSAIAAKGEMHIANGGKVSQPVPRALTTAEVEDAIEEYVMAAKNAVAAGFDGVEFHAANGYLMEQFLNPGVNQRTDQYGGSIEARSRFLLSILTKAASEIGKEKIGVRFSPYGVFNDMPAYDEVDATYAYLAEELNKLDIVYVHVLDHSSMGTPPVPQGVKDIIRSKFRNTLIACGGFDHEKAEAALADGSADLVAFGREYIANPDLEERFEAGAKLNEPDMSTFYVPGAKGYTDYPSLEKEKA